MIIKDVISPFGGNVDLVKSFDIGYINQIYLDKCGLDISKYFKKINYKALHLLQCKKTGYKFWFPFGVSGPEEFYAEISKAWPNYYKTDRWEYDLASKYVRPKSSLLEIGCGKGYFLQKMESKDVECVGLEFNNEAIVNKVCRSEVYREFIEDHIKRGTKYDVVVSFQVLEHVEDPMSFIKSALRLLNAGGKLVLSTPNNDFAIHKNFQDAFDFPPHHVGQYNKQVYENISEILKINVLGIHAQNTDINFPRFESKTEKSIAFKVYRKLSVLMGNVLLHYYNEPGHTIMCVYEKT